MSPKRENKNAIGPALKQLRSAQNWSLGDFAAKCQLVGFDASEDTIRHIESQHRKVSDIEFMLIARALSKPLKHVLLPEKLPDWEPRSGPSSR